MQADCLLYIRQFFPDRKHFTDWYPRCLPYAGFGGSMELFVKATSDRGFEPLKTLLRVKNRTELMNGFKELMADRSRMTMGRISYSLSDILNLEELNRIAK